MFIILVICDSLYSRRELFSKYSASTVFMIIYAVIFALCAIGALIVAVFAIVNLLIGAVIDGNEGALTILITGLIIAVVYGATLLRTLRPLMLKRASLLYGIFMGLVTISVTAPAIAGPTLYTRETKDDCLTERGLPDIGTNIRSHAA